MITGRGNEGIAAEALCLGVSNYIVKDSQQSSTNFLSSVILHLERSLEIEPTMRKSAGALKESQEHSKQQFLTLLDTAERYEHQARELASLAEELPMANERLTAFANHDELNRTAEFAALQGLLEGRDCNGATQRCGVGFHSRRLL